MSKQARLLALLLATTPLGAAAQELTFGGELWLDARLFPDSPRWNDQDDVLLSPSIAFMPTVQYDFANGDRFNAKGFLRVDPDNQNRTHADVREAYYLHQDDGWDFLIGVNQVFWGAAESRHLVNVINQTDSVEDFDSEDYLGQPMANLTLFGDWGTADFYVMPKFRERTHNSTEGRFSFPVSVSDDADYESDMEDWHIDLAARLRTTVQNWDIGVSQFWGTSREPRYGIVQDQSSSVVAPELQSILDIIAMGGTPDVDESDILSIANFYTSVVPRYDIVGQTGLELTGVYDDLILKFEGLVRYGQSEPIFSMVGGFEYTFPNAEETGLDVGLLGEYLYDSRDSRKVTSEEGYLVILENPGTIYNNDIFAGMRLTFNDSQDRQLLAGAVVDLDQGSTILSIEYKQRLLDFMSLEVTGRMIPYAADEDPLHYYKDDSYIEARLKLFF